MSRARILADYVSGGTTAAEFDYMDGVTSNVQTQMDAKLATATATSTYAPKASPAFTGTPTGITAAHLEAGVLPSDVTGGSGLTALGTVTAGTLGSGVNHPTGSVIKVHQQITAMASTINWISGTNQLQIYTFTPDTRTNSLVITSYCMGQWYGNSSVTHCQIDFKLLHNGTEYRHIDDVHHNFSANDKHGVFNINHTEIIAVNHASASGSRAVIMQVIPVAGRFWIYGSATATERYDEPSITIMELA
jgi:hypothetical protein